MKLSDLPLQSIHALLASFLCGGCFSLAYCTCPVRLSVRSQGQLPQRAVCYSLPVRGFHQCLRVYGAVPRNEVRRSPLQWTRARVLYTLVSVHPSLVLLVEVRFINHTSDDKSKIRSPQLQHGSLCSIFFLLLLLLFTSVSPFVRQISLRFGTPPLLLLSSVSAEKCARRQLTPPSSYS